MSISQNHTYIATNTLLAQTTKNVITPGMTNGRDAASAALGIQQHMSTQLAYQRNEAIFSYGIQHPQLVGDVLLQPTGMTLNVPIRELTPPPPVEVKVEPPSEVTNASTSKLEQTPPDEPDVGEIEIQVRNVVCNYTLPFHIDLRRVALNSSNVELDRGRGTLIKQIRRPMCLIKIYNSGKVYIVGCRSEADSKRAARVIARSIQKAMGKLDTKICMRNYKVCNVLATCRMPFGIKIEEMANKYKEHATYEPELSVGLIWRSKDPKATLRIHTTGSITVTGACSEADVLTVLGDIYDKVKEFRCSDRNRQERRVTRKRPTRNRTGAGPSAKQQYKGGNMQQRPQSGLIGNRVYFSDDEDDYLDEDDY